MDKPEPFCIKPEDYFATKVINYWIGIASLCDLNYKPVNMTKLAKAKAHCKAIKAWQKANPDKVKVPD
jgi:hypothetical protein